MRHSGSTSLPLSRGWVRPAGDGFAGTAGSRCSSAAVRHAIRAARSSGDQVRAGGHAARPEAPRGTQARQRDGGVRRDPPPGDRRGQMGRACGTNRGWRYGEAGSHASRSRSRRPPPVASRSSGPRPARPDGVRGTRTPEGQRRAAPRTPAGQLRSIWRPLQELPGRHGNRANWRGAPGSSSLGSRPPSPRAKRPCRAARLRSGSGAPLSPEGTRDTVGESSGVRANRTRTCLFDAASGSRTVADQRKAAITAFQSLRNRSLSSKWMLIQNCRAPASAAAPIFATHSSTVPAIAKRSAR